MGILIIHIIPIMDITLMAPFRSSMISMIFIISVMMATLIVPLAAVILVVILMGVTAVAVTAGGGALDRQMRAGGFLTPAFLGES